MTRRRWLLVATGAVVLGLAAFAMVWFQPHKLFIDDRVDEDLPVATASDDVDGGDADDDAPDEAPDAGDDQLPVDVPWERFASVVIWCDRFDSAFGAADLS